MLNFNYYSPTRLIFGKGTISELSNLLKPYNKILFSYGGGSIKKNNVYAQVVEVLASKPYVEFAGIEPNPTYETCMKAVELGKKEGVDFILAVGGGSVIDAAKFISAAICYEGTDPWDILAKAVEPKKNLKIGSVLTLPATASEMNGGSVISRKSTQEKLSFMAEISRPVFSILDPETTYTLPWRQTANGVVDTYVHVTEQYLTYPSAAPLNDRFAEGVLMTLTELGPELQKNPDNYDLRANMMWCATNGLNGWIGCGVPQDWATHMIGHELTALYGIDHGQSLAVVLPGLLRNQADQKKDKLSQYARRVWNFQGNDSLKAIEFGINKTEEFFKSLGVGVTLRDYNIPKEAAQIIAGRFEERGVLLGETRGVGPKQVYEILSQRY